MLSWARTSANSIKVHGRVLPFFFSCNSGVLVSVEAVSKTTLYIRTVLCLKDRHFLI